MTSADKEIAFRPQPGPQEAYMACDADVVVFDPAGETLLGGDAFDDGTGPSVYAGLTARGRVRAVLLRGRVLVADGKLARRGLGRFLAAPEPSWPEGVPSYSAT